MRTVVRGDRGGKLWNEYVARYHYLGYKTLVGAQMRYAVHASDGMPLAMLGFSTAGWTLAPRDRFIGWSRRLREKNLPLVVDNPRFLILPWIRIPNLGSHILALVRRPDCRPTGPRATRRPPCSSKPSLRLPATPAPSTGPRAGSASAPPRAVDATGRTTATTSPRRTSGCGPSARTGSAPSTGRSKPVCSARRPRSDARRGPAPAGLAHHGGWCGGRGAGSPRRSSPHSRRTRRTPIPD